MTGYSVFRWFHLIQGHRNETTIHCVVVSTKVLGDLETWHHPNSRWTSRVTTRSRDGYEIGRRFRSFSLGCYRERVSFTDGHSCVLNVSLSVTSCWRILTGNKMKSDTSLTSRVLRYRSHHQHRNHEDRKKCHSCHLEFRNTFCQTTGSSTRSDNDIELQTEIATLRRKVIELEDTDNVTEDPRVQMNLLDARCPCKMSGCSWKSFSRDEKYIRCVSQKKIFWCFTKNRISKAM